MIKKIVNGNVYFWLVLHIALGFLAGLNHNIAIGWAYVLIGSTVIATLKYRREFVLHYFFAYYVSFELFARMLRLTPFVPVESGKYLAMFLMLIGLSQKPNNIGKFKVSNTGLAICVLSVPSIFFMKLDDTFWSNLVFCWFGIFDLGLFVLYFSNFSFSKEEIINIFKLMVYPLISISAYLFVNTPTLSDLQFGISANAEASGNFGPNQVSSILGVGIFVVSIALIMGYTLFKNKFVDIGILLLFIFRCVLTVSRGGMFSAILGVAIIYFLSSKSKSINQRIARFATFTIITLSVFFTFQYVNKISGNTLNERYRGTTVDVYNGEKESDLETLTDGRSTIALAEIEIFLHNPMFGVGPGQSSTYWDISQKFIADDAAGNEVVASHTEFTRLLAEHGLMGLVICILLIYPMWFYWKKRRELFTRGFAYYLNLGFLVFGLSMSVHSSMRTMITPFFFGLAFAGMNIRPASKDKMSSSIIEKPFLKTT